MSLSPLTLLYLFSRMLIAKGIGLVVTAAVFFAAINLLSLSSFQGLFARQWTNGDFSFLAEQSKAITDDFINSEVNPENIRNNLRHLTSRPHLGGTETEWENAQWVADTWRAQGLDDVHLVPYDVLLSYPKNDTPNLVRILNSAGEEVWASHGWQKPIHAPEESSPEILPNFNAYSAPGNITGDVVYAHFGREQDFKKLEELGVSVKGKIVLARYGEVFRANIASTAERQGAAGVLLYSDPQQYAPLGEDTVYPGTVYMPGSAVPAGTVYLMDGDPLTPFYPSVESAYRLPEEEASLPKIPIQPISYDDAREILGRMDGDEAPEEWRGGLNVTYRLGPGFQEAGWQTHLQVHTHNVRTTTYNVVATIRGSEEPDRYVILGNHRDAWVFGGLDPSSGTAALLEVTRVLASLRNETGWKPRRSVVVCSWGSEEYGLIGSQEWSEQFGKQLADRAVAYLNVDMAIEGNYTLRTKGVPLLYDSVFEAAAKVPNPDPSEVEAGRTTVYDTWVARQPDDDHPGRPRVKNVGSGSDYKSFLHNLGVPALDIRYTHEPEMYAEFLYHTLYETFALVDELYDIGFNFHAAMAKLWAILAVDIADAQLIPFSVMEYSNFLTKGQQEVLQEYGELISSKNITMEYFEAAVTGFSQATQKFLDDLDLLDTADVLAVRRVNDQLMMVERSFIDPRGLLGRPEYNHVILAPSTSNSYSGTAFSGLTDPLDGIQDLDPIQQEARWTQFSQNLATITHFISTASKVLSDDLW
ncbi:hypothetical protein C7M84_003149 [Penaeus vannamei]|uniref:glutamate carboxypeptidase II n=1 Tax=Penaeus vannamei TaxID=6689 RepID=A0A423TNU3_PENVA|nr:hypothetical protein C7M84_003149 [Penaeus vannamei]